MKKELKTMEEKNQLNPNELMENGLTREHNEKLDKQGDNLSGVWGIISLVIGVWVIIQAMSNLNYLN